MKHSCYICHKEIPLPAAEAQNSTQPPGNFLACDYHTQEVDTLNFQMREIQHLRNVGYSDKSLATQIRALNDLEAAYRVAQK
jgi:hypothetical protein